MATIDLLLSFAYFGPGEADRTPFVTHPCVGRSIIDSGAFTALTSGTTIDRDAYHRWLAEEVLPSGQISWAAALDVIRDPEGSWDNWQAANADGLALVPTVHIGAEHPEPWIDRYAEAGATLIGLGGLVGQKPKHVLSYVAACFRHAYRRWPDVRFHGWGVAANRLMQFPWYSFDSSVYALGVRYGKSNIYDAQGKRLVFAHGDRATVHGHAPLLRRFYGMDPKLLNVTVETMTDETYQQVLVLAVRSAAAARLRLRARSLVLPPEGKVLAVPDLEGGPHTHLTMLDLRRGQTTPFLSMLDWLADWDPPATYRRREA